MSRLLVFLPIAIVASSVALLLLRAKVARKRAVVIGGIAAGVAVEIIAWRVDGSIDPFLLISFTVASLLGMLAAAIATLIAERRAVSKQSV